MFFLVKGLTKDFWFAVLFPPVFVLIRVPLLTMVLTQRLRFILSFPPVFVLIRVPLLTKVSRF
jgi:hypothetical protein